MPFQKSGRAMENCIFNPEFTCEQIMENGSGHCCKEYEVTPQGNKVSLNLHLETKESGTQKSKKAGEDALFICPRCGGQMINHKTYVECEDCKYREEIDD